MESLSRSENVEAVAVRPDVEARLERLFHTLQELGLQVAVFNWQPGPEHMGPMTSLAAPGIAP